ncbi:hypothetical protein BC830DRAFT_390212 [Chytriomyces sp. MP71]|nr:hypothetical protein BC830DRAFT_390212 [Chytriomyces sp. MP71]
MHSSNDRVFENDCFDTTVGLTRTQPNSQQPDDDEDEAGITAAILAPETPSNSNRGLFSSLFQVLATPISGLFSSASPLPRSQTSPQKSHAENHARDERDDEEAAESSSAVGENPFIRSPPVFNALLKDSEASSSSPSAFVSPVSAASLDLNDLAKSPFSIAASPAQPVQPNPSQSSSSVTQAGKKGMKDGNFSFAFGSSTSTTSHEPTKSNEDHETFMDAKEKGKAVESNPVENGSVSSNASSKSPSKYDDIIGFISKKGDAPLSLEEAEILQNLIKRNMNGESCTGF